MNSTKKQNDWLAWLNWDNEAHCQWALEYLDQFGIGHLPAQNQSAKTQLTEIVGKWPAWQSCFGADQYTHLESQMRIDYKAFKAKKA